MRVLRLDVGGDLGEVDLHPFVTVLHHLGPSRERFLAALRAVVQGEDEAPGGLIEHQGLLVELAPGTSAGEPPAGAGHVVVDVDELSGGEDEQRLGLQAQLDQLERRASIDAAMVEEVRADLDPAAVAELDGLDDPASGAAGPVPAAGGAAAARPDLEAALAAWRTEPPTITTAEPWVLELGDRLEDHLRSGSDFGAALERLDRRVEAASRRLAAARGALRNAEAAATPVLLTAEEENRLSELATRPFGRGRKRRQKARPEEEQAEIDELLGRVSQPTYSAYMVYRLAPTPPAEQQVAIDAARRAVEHAEAELASARAARQDDPGLEAHRRGLEELRAVAVAHLGPVLPADLGEALALQRREVPNPERDHARQHLVWVALGAGVDLPDHADDDAVAEAVEAWLEHTGPDADGDQDRGAADRALLTRRVARHRRALQCIDAAEARAVESRSRARELRDRLSSRERRSCSVGDVVAAVERDTAAAGDAGPRLPLVVTGSLDHLDPADVRDLLDRLELFVSRWQVVVVTDHPAAVAWAEHAGLRRALPTGPAVVAG